MSENGEYCTRYVVREPGEKTPPCKCPNCGGFLSFHVGQTKTRCRKCGTPLEIIPSDDNLQHGKICMKPEHMLTPHEKHEIKMYRARRKQIREEKRRRKKTKTPYVALFHGLTRRVWRNEKIGAFVVVDGERVSLRDLKINQYWNTDTGNTITEIIVGGSVY